MQNYLKTFSFDQIKYDKVKVSTLYHLLECNFSWWKLNILQFTIYEQSIAFMIGS